MCIRKSWAGTQGWAPGAGAWGWDPGHGTPCPTIDQSSTPECSGPWNPGYMQEEIRTARNAVHAKTAIDQHASSSPKHETPLIEVGGNGLFGAGLLRSLGIMNRTSCLGGERLQK